MANKTLDSEVLAALHLMSKDKVDGVRYLEFIKQNIMNGALDLIERGYAKKINIGHDDANYCLTPRGIQYLEKILDFAKKEF